MVQLRDLGGLPLCRTLAPRVAVAAGQRNQADEMAAQNLCKLASAACAGYRPETRPTQELSGRVIGARLLRPQPGGQSP